MKNELPLDQVVVGGVPLSAGLSATPQDDRIREALVELLYRNSYGVVAANVLISLPAAYILSSVVSPRWFVGWLAALYLLTAARVVAARLFFRHVGKGGSVARWAWLAAVMSWLSGLMWGMLGWVGFLPHEPLLFAFTVIVLTGLVCGTVPSLSAFPPALIGSILATTVPVAIRCLTSEGEVFGAYLFLIGSLLAINLYYCRVTYRMLHETVRLRTENVELIGRLEDERDRAQAADRAKTRFLAAASHDLRQPIHALSLLVSTLAMMGQRGAVAAADARSIAGKAKSMVGNLSGLLNALLDISKLDAGVVTVERETVDLGELFRNLRQEFAPTAGERGLGWRVVETGLHVDSDPMMLKRILDNLLSNAFRYTTAGRVLLGCRRRGAAVEIQVWDTGPGIPADQQAAVFEEFVQLHNPARDRAQGLGLGLAIVRRTTELLGHPLKLVSVSGRGSMFSVTVPLVQAAKPPRAASDVRMDGAPLGIMVVEDEQDVLGALVQMLEFDGHRVYAGRSAEEVMNAHAAAKEGSASVGVIVADYRLKDHATGVEAIDALYDYLGRAVPAIIVTGDTSPARIKEAARSGHRLLHKPISGEDLREAIRREAG
jgi:signal transduction histidine kinase/CheY-like chemotaxis protein